MSIRSAYMKLSLSMPVSMSGERRVLLRAMGANLILTPAESGMRGAIAAAEEFLAGKENAWMPQQFDNPANPGIHESTTGPEIWIDSGGRIDALVAGVGTGGTLTGIARYLKRINPEFKSIVVEPASSPVISGGRCGPHKIQGLGAGFIPKNLDMSLVDDVVTVSDEEAVKWSRKLARLEGLVVGISSGANMAAAAKIAARPDYRGKRIVTILGSLGDRYLSTPLFSDFVR